MNTYNNNPSNLTIGRGKIILLSVIGLLPLIGFILFLVINIFFLVHYIKTIMERFSVILIITGFTSQMLPYVLVIPLLINVVLFWKVNPKFINGTFSNNFNNKTSCITNFIIQTIKRVISTSIYGVTFGINNLKSIFVKSVKTS